jgi:phosphoglycolate phosphatase
MKTFFFDLDGTLIDSKADISSALIKALSEANINISSIADKIVIGKQLSPLLHDLIPEISSEQEAQVIKLFRKNYDYSDFKNTLPYPGIEILLRRLHLAGTSLFIVTNKPKLPTHRITEILNWTPFFAETFSPDSINPTPLKKPELLKTIINRYSCVPSQCIMIGDSEEDWVAGQTCGIKTGLVSWGYGNPNKSKLATDFWFDTAEQILELL